MGLWRHASSPASIVGPAGISALVLGSVITRLARPLAALGLPLPGRFAGVHGLARTLGVSYRRGSGPGDPRLLAWLTGLRPDLVLSLQSHRVPAQALAIPRLGWLNLHHGRILDYRGTFSVFWAIRHHEPVLYATAHLMGSRFDNGPVVSEVRVPVVAGASVAEMEARMWAVSPDVLLRAVERLEAEADAAFESPRAAGRYYTYPTRRDVRPASRAASPQAPRKARRPHASSIPPSPFASTEGDNIMPSETPTIPLGTSRNLFFYTTICGIIQKARQAALRLALSAAKNNVHRPGSTPRTGNDFKITGGVRGKWVIPSSGSD